MQRLIADLNRLYASEPASNTRTCIQRVSNG